MVERKATNVWQGDLKEGSGKTSFDSSGAIPPVDMTFPRRAGEPEGYTSPDELIAAAHATCYNMGLSSALSNNGHPPERIETSAEVTFTTEGGPHISRIALHVRATVPGISSDDFLEAAAAAKDGCPVSKLVSGNTEITLDAALQ
ncbi:OsmC family peroxiredoxin [Egibacter rhizosphaerae]|uniref:OsmC family peroxiredoxin n=1 Tax=Egibacter rhizosphaerae TaxID=1670831 RepID=A0A411YKC1_9ACTN|nr:OsmC family peroxiredoxin [Egibacter rhizosphaerae]QBI21631.1 OsmC family peroxiredoxin [Egibacter rhizosphaerae]